MNINDQTILLKKITETLLGTYDFRELAKRAVNLFIKEIKPQNLLAAGIFRLNEAEHVVSAYAYSSKYSQIINKVLPAKFSELRIPSTEIKNLIVKCIVTNQMQQGKRISEFSHGVIPDNVADKVQQILRAKSAVVFPVQIRSGKVAGAFMAVATEEQLSGEQLILCQTFASQLGLVFSNVFQFEKLMAKYQNLTSNLTKHLNEEDIPSVKFTLRVSPKENKKLEQLARERGKTKAELIRELLDKI